MQIASSSRAPTYPAPAPRESSESGHDLSGYLPTMWGLFKKLPYEYTNLKMSRDGQWDEFIATGEVLGGLEFGGVFTRL